VKKKKRKLERREKEQTGPTYLKININVLPDSTQHCFYKQEGLTFKPLLLPLRPMAYTHCVTEPTKLQERKYKNNHHSD
jgi:hypothetical protein